MAMKKKPFKRFTFADGFYCYARGYSRQELEREMEKHGRVVRCRIEGVEGVEGGQDGCRSV